MLNCPPLEKIDFYKSGHYAQYPKGIQKVLSNFTARSGRLSNIKLNPTDPEFTIFGGLQLFVKAFLMQDFTDNFFNKPKEMVVRQYKRRMDNALGKGSVDMAHIEALHDLGYMPLLIKALPEGTYVPEGVPSMTIVNTRDEFYWLTNYIETITSCMLWKTITSATTSFAYKKLLMAAAIRTGASLDFVKFQAHDFSFRGMSGLDDAIMSGIGHLFNFVGTDTVPAIWALEQYYNANSDVELVGCSVPATEHSVMCAGSKDSELDTIRRLATEVYPTGILSVVSDTWDFWQVITKYLVILKPEIMARPGKYVSRPDSGDPVDIICGTVVAPENTPAHRGTIQCLWDTFSGTYNAKDFKELDSHVGAIYGDSITLQRADQITRGLEAKGFASSNIVLGVGSYTYEYVTRDTHGMAIKSTAIVMGGKWIPIFKDPVTDKDNFKKSATGLIKVVKGPNGLPMLVQNCDVDGDFSDDLLEVVFENGILKRDHTLAEIRARIEQYL